MDFNERALAAITAMPKPPQARTEAEIDAERSRAREAAAKDSLDEWFAAMNLGAAAPKPFIEDRRLQASFSSGQRRAPVVTFLCWFLFRLDGHDYSGKYEEHPTIGRPKLNIWIEIEPDYSFPVWWHHSALLPAATLVHVGAALLEEQRRRSQNIDRAATRRAGLEMARQYDQLCLVCEDNTLTIPVILDRDPYGLAGCKHCKTGVYSNLT